MKKLIKDLADEAGFVLWNGEEHAPVDAVVDWSCSYDYELEKFADLVVQKCVQRIALIGVSNFENDDIGWATEAAISVIRDTFDKGM